MDLSPLIEWSKNPGHLDAESLVVLQRIIEQYPGFSMANMLYLKNLAILKDPSFSKVLPRVAMIVPDRKRLYEFIKDGVTVQVKVECPEPVKQKTSDSKKTGEVTSFSVIDRFLESARKPGRSTEKDSQVNEPDDLDTLNRHYLQSVEWVSEMAMSHESVSGNNNGTPLKGQNLINAYLNEEANPMPPISKKFHREMVEQVEQVEQVETVEGDNPMIAEPEMDEPLFLPESSFTEALARVYLKQKRYNRALEIIRSLSLKYPEKNSYFADQIRFLEKLNSHTK